MDKPIRQRPLNELFHLAEPVLRLDSHELYKMLVKIARAYKPNPAKRVAEIEMDHLPSVQRRKLSIGDIDKLAKATRVLSGIRWDHNKKEFNQALTYGNGLRKRPRDVIAEVMINLNPRVAQRR